MFNHFLSIPATLMLAFCSVSCSDGSGDNPAPAPDAITASVESLAFDAAGGEQSFTVTSLKEWDAQSPDSWIKVSRTGQLEKSGTVTVTVGANSERKERAGSIIVYSGGASTTVAVKQQSKEPEPVDPTIKVPEGYELVWHDEFDGNSLSGDWTHEVKGPGWVNNELQTYVNAGVNGQPVTEVADGKLSIHCFKLGNTVYSGRIYANVKTGWQYGIFEARIKLPKGKGTWPAYWMMPVSSSDPWPKCGEIDIMEEVGYNPNYTSSSVHTQNYNHTIGTQRTAERLTQGAQDEFHIYRLEWTPSYIRTYVDDNALLTFNNDGTGNVNTWPYDKAFYIILNLAWGGDWGGAMGVDESCLPATMEVDYVRVFQSVQ